MITYIATLGLLLLTALFFLLGPTFFRAMDKRRLLVIVIILAVFAGVFSVDFYLRDAASSISMREINNDYQPYIEDYLAGRELDNIEAIEPAYFIRALQVYLQQNGFDRNAWLTLANALRATESSELALRAYERAHRVDPENIDVAITYVNARLAFNEKRAIRQVDQQALEVLEDVLQQDPQHSNALMLLGASGFQGRDYALAVDAWSRLLALLQSREGQESAPQKVLQALEESIAKAQALHDGSTSEQADFRLLVQVELAEGLQESYLELKAETSEAVLFVFARSAEEGAGVMPLAALRLPLKDIAAFPVTVELNNTNSLMGIDLGSQKQIKLVARLSMSGQASASENDWQSKEYLVEPLLHSGPVVVQLNR